MKELKGDAETMLGVELVVVNNVTEVTMVDYAKKE
jgi:hypothetical protein